MHQTHVGSLFVCVCVFSLLGYMYMCVRTSTAMAYLLAKQVSSRPPYCYRCMLCLWAETSACSAPHLVLDMCENLSHAAHFVHGVAGGEA
mmetsp:Transcript_25533/g.63258  ORF Transcript_25533/g.63258 Transcript_25533/m.63258 type:complete len:90 (-) Transcript_25533:9-278(-)